MTAIADQPADAQARMTRHHGPERLVLSEHPVFRRFWYAACFADVVQDAPVARTVLGTSIVLWRPEPGAPVRAALDRCAHRDAPLSMGWVADCHLICPYHGWEWDAEGRTQRIPQFPTSPFPTKGGLTMVAVQERYGLVFVCLATEAEGGPIADIPEVPEFDDPAWRVVPEREWAFTCTAMHLLENNFDPGHVAFVHRGSFGDPAHSELSESTADVTPFGLRVHSETPVASRPGETGVTLRRTVSDLHMPFFGVIRITYPDGLGHIMVKAITPVDDENSVNIQIVLRTDQESDRPAADIVAFDDIAEEEDRVLLDRVPVPFPLAPYLNAHAKADRASLAIRRLWTELVTGRFVPRE